MIADQESHTGTLGRVDRRLLVQALHFDSEDNVDDVPTVLKTATRTTTLGYGLPLDHCSPTPKAHACLAAGLRQPDLLADAPAEVNRPPSFDPSTRYPIK
jgi:hypothetical protein